MPMPSLFRIGQVLTGRVGKYTISKEVQETVWFAKKAEPEAIAITMKNDGR